ncbi:MAG TPA: ABC transporter ATP-binding protein [Myxococcaceae bacterium]|nr:ABC transporter ATP-binding protein [Myxococcaceae bacterium]
MSASSASAGSAAPEGLARSGVGQRVLKVEGVSLSLGGQKVLDGCDFEVFDRIRPGLTTGQVVALLGPSGVGKTRLLRIIAGLDAPDAGRVLGMGDVSLEAGRVGVVFQDYPLLKHRTVQGNLEIAGITNGLSAADARRRSKELLERFRLADRARHFPAQLSGGQRQRVAIAQQLVVPKHLLLMDEPFSGLDPRALDEVAELLVEVAHMDELNTIILVTHDVHAAMVVSDTLLMLGRVHGPEGKLIPGASIQASYDLVAKNLAWSKGIDETPEFAVLEREVRGLFKTL